MVGSLPSCVTATARATIDPMLAPPVRSLHAECALLARSAIRVPIIDYGTQIASDVAVAFGDFRQLDPVATCRLGTIERLVAVPEQ